MSDDSTRIYANESLAGKVFYFLFLSYGGNRFYALMSSCRELIRVLSGSKYRETTCFNELTYISISRVKDSTGVIVRLQRRFLLREHGIKSNAY